MTHAERGPRDTKIHDRVKTQLASFVEGGDPKLSPLAQRVLAGVETEQLGVVVIERRKPWFIDFQVTRAAGEMGALRGILYIDAARTDTAKGSTFDSELVRSTALAATYFRNEYTKPLRQIYSDAIELQLEWLGQQEARGVLLDPRITPHSDREVLLRNILGTQAYYFDFDFSSWQQAAHERLERLQRVDLPDKGKRIRLTELLGEDQQAFLIARSQNSSLLWDSTWTPARYSYIEVMTAQERMLKAADRALAAHIDPLI